MTKLKQLIVRIPMRYYVALKNLALIKSRTMQNIVYEQVIKFIEFEYKRLENGKLYYSYRFKKSDYEGKKKIMYIRIDLEQHEKIKKISAHNNTSISYQLSKVIMNYIDTYYPKLKPPKK